MAGHALIIAVRCAGSRECKMNGQVKKLPVVLALVVVAAACVAETYVPFRVSRSLLLVDVIVDGAPKILVFDTGAERTLIHDSRNIERASRLTLGDKTFSNFPLAYVNLAGMELEKVHADGVLGQDVIGKFRKITVDYQSKRVIFE
jgi:hypothetical protein